jgi:hypothetical protein
VARVLKCLLNLALHYGEVRPSLDGIKRLACVCKQTVVNCLKVLTLYGLVNGAKFTTLGRTGRGLRVTLRARGGNLSPCPPFQSGISTVN